MTDQELRALDAEVAEKVMGWVWMQRVGDDAAWLFPPDSKDETRTGNFGYPVVSRCGYTGPFEPYRGGRKEKSDFIPLYSSEITAARLVVEKMRENVAGFELDYWPEEEPNGWLACFGNNLSEADLRELGLNPSTTRSECTGETAQVAICNAALAWARGGNSRFLRPKAHRDG